MVSAGRQEVREADGVRREAGDVERMRREVLGGSQET